MDAENSRAKRDESGQDHKMLDSMQHLFEDIPIVMFYPGTFNGQTLNLFDEFKEGNYYRAFNLL